MATDKRLVFFPYVTMQNEHNLSDCKGQKSTHENKVFLLYMLCWAIVGKYVNLFFVHNCVDLDGSICGCRSNRDKKIPTGIFEERDRTLVWVQQQNSYKKAKWIFSPFYGRASWWNLSPKSLRELNERLSSIGNTERGCSNLRRKMSSCVLLAS